MNPEIETLILRVQEGDESAFKDLYDHYARRVLNFAYRLTNAREIAEDVTQETFIAVYRHIHSLKEVTRFEPWLFMIARNYVYQTFRKRKLKFESTDDLVEDDREISAATPSSHSPEAQMLKGELRERTMQMIQDLPIKYREVFVLAVLEGWSYKDVADVVGRRMQSVKTDIHRARMKIREALGQYLARSGEDSNEMR